MKDKKKVGMILLIFVLSGFGIIQLGLLLHETIHVFQSDNPSQMCLNFGGDNTLAYVSADDFQANTEIWAYGINGLFVLIGIILLTIYSKREIDKL